MLRLRIGGVAFHLSFWFFAAVALFALLERGALVFYLALPIAVHELGHLIVMAACGVRARSVSFTALGVNIRRDSGNTLSYAKEIAVCLGGPAVNLAMALWLHLACFHSMRVMLLVAANIAVAVFNLAPIGDLDGGQIVSLLTARFFSPSVSRAISRAASFLVLGLLFGFAIFLALIRWPNPSLFVACAFLTANVIARD